MSVLVPKYMDSIVVHNVIFGSQGDCTNKALEIANTALLGYIQTRMYVPLSSPLIRGEDSTGYTRTIFAMAPTDIVVVYNQYMEKAKSGGGVSDRDDPLASADVQLFSFRTPVDSVKEKLTEIVRKACRQAPSSSASTELHPELVGVPH